MLTYIFAAIAAYFLVGLWHFLHPGNMRPEGRASLHYVLACVAAFSFAFHLIHGANLLPMQLRILADIMPSGFIVQSMLGALSGYVLRKWVLSRSAADPSLFQVPSVIVDGEGRLGMARVLAQLLNRVNIHLVALVVFFMLSLLASNHDLDIKVGEFSLSVAGPAARTSQRSLMRLTSAEDNPHAAWYGMHYLAAMSRTYKHDLRYRRFVRELPSHAGSYKRVQSLLGNFPLCARLAVEQASPAETMPISLLRRYTREISRDLFRLISAEGGDEKKLRAKTRAARRRIGERFGVKNCTPWSGPLVKKGGPLNREPHAYFALADLEYFNGNALGAVHRLRKGLALVEGKEDPLTRLRFRQRIAFYAYHSSEVSLANKLRYYNQYMEGLESLVKEVAAKRQGCDAHSAKCVELNRLRDYWNERVVRARNFIALLLARVGRQEMRARYYAAQNLKSNRKDPAFVDTYGYVKLAFASRKSPPNIREIKEALRYMEQAADHLRHAGATDVLKRLEREKDVKIIEQHIMEARLYLFQYQVLSR